MIVYKTTNLINGKFYIGQDLNNNPNYLGSGLMLNNAIKKYGKENFKKEIIEVCNSKDELNEREKFWIKELNSQDREIGYNIADGGTGGKTWQNYTDPEMIKNTKEKRSKSTSERNKRLGGFLKDKNRQKVACSNGNKKRTMNGYKHSEETKAKIGDAHRGKEVSEEARKNISEATKAGMSKVDMKALYKEKVEGKLKAAWEARDRQRLEILSELDSTGMNHGEKCKALGVSYPTYQKLRKMIDNKN
jgi:group I intron endonuclease